MALLGLPVGLVATLAVILTGPIAALLLVAGTLAFVGVVFAPGVLFGAYLLIAFYKGALQQFSPVDITVVLALLNALQIIPLIAERRSHDISRVGTLLWVAVAFLVLGGVLYGPDQDLALGHAANYWALVLLPILPAALRVGSKPRYLREFLWTFFGVGGLIVVLGVTNLTSTNPLVVLGMNTIQTSRAALLVPLLGLTFMLWERVALVRPITIVLIPLAFVVALATGSRGPLLVLAALGALGGMRALVRPRTVDWRLVGAITGLALASVVVLSLVAQDLPTLSVPRFASFADFLGGGLSDNPGASGDTSSITRVRLFGLAVTLFEGQPILGVGTAGFEALSPAAIGPMDAGAYPHNAVLQFAAEYGVVGVALFTSLIFIALTRRLPDERSAHALRALFLFYLLNAMVSGDIFSDRETWGLLLLLLLMDVGARAVTRSDLPDPPIGLP
jgi:hypothetical protein